ncbi:MAG: hypothetical protein V4596_04815 [Bdellovibrionota bacterium]
MEQENWLPLIEYSNKHQISISTLRRRIKDNSILFKLEDGKYFIVDDSVEKATRGRKPIVMPNQFAQSSSTDWALDPQPKTVQKNEILEELKKAYLASLQGKEEQIFQLKEEVSDLKTLVRVLEFDNERLKKELENINGFSSRKNHF